MSLISFIKEKFNKNKKKIEESTEPLDITMNVDFNQTFFLYNLYQWMLEKPQASNDKIEINSLIAINYFVLKEKHHFPDNSFDHFENRNGIPISEYIDGLYRVKEKERLISEFNLSFMLTENGKRVVEIIKRGNYYDYDFFDKSTIKHFNQDLIDSIDSNIRKLKNLSDLSLISTSLNSIR